MRVATVWNTLCKKKTYLFCTRVHCQAVTCGGGCLLFKKKTNLHVSSLLSLSSDTFVFLSLGTNPSAQHLQKARFPPGLTPPSQSTHVRFNTLCPGLHRVHSPSLLSNGFFPQFSKHRVPKMFPLHMEDKHFYTLPSARADMVYTCLSPCQTL